VFTTIDGRKAAEEEIQSFTSEAELAALKGAGEIDEKSILKFPETSKMSTTPGKKEGDITVFREGK
jgi:Xaa-Pro aminopeptidase